jgi:hypothetical protein
VALESAQSRTTLYKRARVLRVLEIFEETTVRALSATQRVRALRDELSEAKNAQRLAISELAAMAIYVRQVKRENERALGKADRQSEEAPTPSSNKSPGSNVVPLWTSRRKK